MSGSATFATARFRLATAAEGIGATRTSPAFAGASRSVVVVAMLVPSLSPWRDPIGAPRCDRALGRGGWRDGTDGPGRGGTRGRAARRAGKAEELFVAAQ